MIFETVELEIWRIIAVILFSFIGGIIVGVAGQKEKMEKKE